MINDALTVDCGCGSLVANRPLGPGGDSGDVVGAAVDERASRLGRHVELPAPVVARTPATDRRGRIDVRVAVLARIGNGVAHLAEQTRELDESAAAA